MLEDGGHEVESGNDDGLYKADFGHRLMWARYGGEDIYMAVSVGQVVIIQALVQIPATHKQPR